MYCCETVSLLNAHIKVLMCELLALSSEKKHGSVITGKLLV